jgi:hypothetical protein
MYGNLDASHFNKGCTQLEIPVVAASPEQLNYEQAFLSAIFHPIARRHQTPERI